MVKFYNAICLYIPKISPSRTVKICVFYNISLRNKKNLWRNLCSPNYSCIIFSSFDNTSPGLFIKGALVLRTFWGKNPWQRPFAKWKCYVWVETALSLGSLWLPFSLPAPGSTKPEAGLPRLLPECASRGQPCAKPTAWAFRASELSSQFSQVVPAFQFSHFTSPATHSSSLSPPPTHMIITWTRNFPALLTRSNTLSYPSTFSSNPPATLLSPWQALQSRDLLFSLHPAVPSSLHWPLIQSWRHRSSA